MKKRHKVFMGGTLLFLGLFNGCASGFKSSTQTIELEGNPTTGYDWEYELSNPEIVDIQLFVKYLGENKIVGAPSKYTYKLSSVKKGETKLKFKYHRSWEDNSTIRVENYLIKVSARGKLKIIDKTVR